MNTATLRAPVAYDPSLEVPEHDEAETTRELIATIAKIHHKTFEDTGHALRGVHAKSHGLLAARLTVLEGLAPEYAQGLFATPGSYDTVMRFSTTPGDLLHDNVSTPRGVAIKVLGVPGERLPDSEHDATQDWLMVNGPAFAAPTAAKFLGNLKLLAGTTDKAPRLKQALSATLRGVEAIVEGLGGQSGTLKSLGGHPKTEILGETFFTQGAVLYGLYIAKLQLVPVSPSLVALKGVEVASDESPDYLRESVIKFFATETATWEVRVQLCRDIQIMPIEDASVVWAESESPFVAVAHLTAGPQVAWSAERSQSIDDRMSFSPWHGLAAHRPLGSVMRVRRNVYEAARRDRERDGGASIAEPASGIKQILPG